MMAGKDDYNSSALDFTKHRRRTAAEEEDKCRTNAEIFPSVLDLSLHSSSSALNRLSEMSGRFASFSHDIRNPTMIRGERLMSSERNLNLHGLDYSSVEQNAATDLSVSSKYKTTISSSSSGGGAHLSPVKEKDMMPPSSRNQKKEDDKRFVDRKVSSGIWQPAKLVASREPDLLSTGFSSHSFFSPPKPPAHEDFEALSVNFRHRRDARLADDNIAGYSGSSSTISSSSSSSSFVPSSVYLGSVLSKNDGMVEPPQAAGLHSFGLRRKDKSHEIVEGAREKLVPSHFQHSETALSDVARSSFGTLVQLEDSEEDRSGRKQYDDYAKQLADFFKSSTKRRRGEQQDSTSISEEDDSQASEALSMNVTSEAAPVVIEEEGEVELHESKTVHSDSRETFLLVCEDGSEGSAVLENSNYAEAANEESCFSVELLLKDENKAIDEEVESGRDVDDEKVENVETPTPVNKTAQKKKRKLKEMTVDDGGTESQSSSKPKRRKTGLPQMNEQDSQSTFPVQKNAFEYQWPQEKNADWFVLQEHISEFLGVLSFKRKYPDITRRPVDAKERDFLRESGVVTEMQCDLGLTALRTEDVCSLVSRDYPDKYQDYTKALNKRQKIIDQNKDKGHDGSNVESAKNKMENQLKKSIKTAAEYNANLMRELHQERKAYFDLQTFEVHYPHNRMKRLMPKVETNRLTTCSSYPIALLSGQYQDYYKRYTPQELKYFPINTALYSPHKMLKSIFTDPNSIPVDDTEEDEENSEDIVDHISITKLKEDEKNAETEKPSALVCLEQEENSLGGTIDDSAENSRSSFKSSRSSRGGSTMSRKVSQRSTTSSIKKKGREPAQKCGVCNQVERNKQGESEDMVHCSECGSTGHPSCLELTKEMVTVIRTYSWQCMECKTCVKCMEPHDEEKMMFCDHCDRGYHTFCVGLKSIPEGRWECPSCHIKDMNSIPKPKPKRGRPFKYRRPERPETSVQNDVSTVL